MRSSSFAKYVCFVLASTWTIRSRATKTLHASVRFYFEVSQTGRGSYDVVNITSARQSFPPEDILVTGITFDGVRIQGVAIQNHMQIHDGTAKNVAGNLPSGDYLSSLPAPPPGMKWAPIPIDKFVYHHTLLHTGSIAGFSHAAHGGIVYGTPSAISSTTSFFPYGIRLRPETRIFTCMHAQNLHHHPIVFEALWNISYESLKSSLPDPRALLTGWVHTTIMAYERGSEESRRGFTHPFQITFMKSVRVVGFTVHNHAWAKSITIEHADQVFFSLNMHSHDHMIMRNESRRRLHGDDKKVHWLGTPEHIKQQESMMVNFTGMFVDDYDWETQLGLSFYVLCDDMTDHLSHIPDLYTVRGLTPAAHSGFLLTEPNPFPE